MRFSKKDIPALLCAICFLGFLFWFSLCNLSLAQEPFAAFFDGTATFRSSRDQLQENYTSDALAHKLDFVDLSGLYARLSGRQLHNEIYRTKNGMLTLVLEQQNMAPLADNFIAFSQSLADMDIPFLYVQAPYKEDFADAILPDGIISYGNENADALLQQLEDGNVEYLDLRPQINATEELINTYYFRTDHHWNIDGAFLGFQLISRQMDAMLPEELDLTYTDKSLWQRHTLEDWFLGSRGKRVGIYFEGVDDYSWLTPTFPTQMSTAIESSGKVYSGNFEAANLRPENIRVKDYHNINVYCNYIGGDYPLVRHRNPDAPNPQSIVIIKDSYVLPVQAFLSTVFQEVVVIDPRHYSNYDITTYVQSKQPDLVIMMMNPSAFPYREYTDFGKGLPFNRLTAMKAPSGDISVPEENTVSLGYGRLYRLQFDDFLSDNPELTETMVAIIPEGSSQAIEYHIFDLASCREEGTFSWYFMTPRYGSQRLKLVFLDGMSMYSSAVYQNVTLYTAAYA